MRNCSILTLFMVALNFGNFAPAEDVFPDKALEAVVRKQVYAKRDSTDPLTAEDVKKISVIEGKGKGIKSLQGLEHCVAIMQIDLEDNEIQDVSQLADLKLLQSVNLAGNQIEDLKPLERLERMQYLQLERNAIQSIAPLTNMSNMRSLYLSENKIEDLSPLKGLSKIWSLYLSGNPVKDLSPIGQLQWLDTIDLSGCKIEDLSFLKPLRLKYLNLSNNKIKDLTVLVEMAKADEARNFAPFWRIHLSDNPLDKQATEAQLTELRELGARIELKD